MFGIPPAQLAPDLRVEPDPETREVGGRLHRPLVWRYLWLLFFLGRLEGVQHVVPL
jgi:hypothetical protein